ncbi:hypothetical protein VNO77_10828 [Canavalia gladiata]|uniref:Uncharacterized protein n=1 Tax=Canavalia gladiata TaxID=3824 RepID=A0AAN9MEM0_CANGL
MNVICYNIVESTLLFTTQVKNRYVMVNNGTTSPYVVNNGTTSILETNAIHSKMVSKHSNLQVKDKEPADLIERKSSSTTAVQATAYS